MPGVSLLGCQVLPASHMRRFAGLLCMLCGHEATAQGSNTYGLEGFGIACPAQHIQSWP